MLLGYVPGTAYVHMLRWQVDSEKRYLQNGQRPQIQNSFVLHIYPLLGNISAQNHILGPYNYIILFCTQKIAARPPGQTERQTGSKTDALGNDNTPPSWIK